MSEPIPQDEALRLQLACIAGNEPDSSYIEIRPLDPPGRQWWTPIPKLSSAAAVIGMLAPDRNVYVGAAPRVRQSGTANAVERVWCLWADCDTPEAVERLRRFRPLPSIVVRSGSGENVHGWWPLKRPLTPTQAVRANRRLALALGADRAATDAARIMRPIGSLNHKHRPARPVECVRLELDTFTPGDLVSGLADDPCYTRPQLVTPLRDGIGDARDALAGLARVVRSAPMGERNQRLNWAAYRAGEHAAAGRFDETEAEAELLAAAIEVGLTEAEASRTIASGLAAGRKVVA